jgi:hypothetical protein
VQAAVIVQSPLEERVPSEALASEAGEGAFLTLLWPGAVDGQRLYQLIRQYDAISDRTFEIEFFDPGVQAYAVTFG